jgi:hypothetical protein
MAKKQKVSKEQQAEESQRRIQEAAEYQRMLSSMDEARKVLKIPPLVD